jgi:hypothetical protein
LRNVGFSRPQNQCANLRFVLPALSKIDKVPGCARPRDPAAGVSGVVGAFGYGRGDV